MAEGKIMEQTHFNEFSKIIDDLIRKKGYGEAIEKTIKFFIEDKDNPLFFITMGKIYENFDIKNAIEYYKEGLSKHPKNVYLFNVNLGFLYYNNKKYNEALNYLLEALPDDITNLKILTAIGNIYKHFNKFNKAVKYFKVAYALDKSNIFALMGLADCYRGLLNYSKSLEYWLTLNQLQPKNKIFYTRIGDSYRNLNQYKKALEYYNKALEIDYDFFAYIGKAKIFKELQQYEEILKINDILKEKEKDNSRYYYEFIKIFLSINETEYAKTLFELANKKFQKNKYIQQLEHFFK